MEVTGELRRMIHHAAPNDNELRDQCRKPGAAFPCAKKGVLIAAGTIRAVLKKSSASRTSEGEH